MEREYEISSERFIRLINSEKESEKYLNLNNYPILPATSLPEKYLPEDNIQITSIIEDNILKYDKSFTLPSTVRDISVGCTSILPLPESIKVKMYDLVDPDRTVDFEFVRKRAAYGLIGVASATGLGIGIAALTNYLSSLSK